MALFMYHAEIECAYCEKTPSSVQAPRVSLCARIAMQITTSIGTLNSMRGLQTPVRRL
jgi:hypothetical protein